MSSRSAEDTIKGYFYQFDYSILKVLELGKNSDTLTVEGIEDVDIDADNNTKAIQCKYYAKTEYNHSVIGKPIRLMLDHFSKVLKGTETKIKYHLYGHYKNGHSKLTLPLTVEDLKKQFLNYSKAKIKYEHHVDLGLTDQNLKAFLKLLTIDINAEKYEDQIKTIHDKLKKEFSCSDFESEYYFYNNALNEIKRLATQSSSSRRRISRGEFIKRINNKKNLFNKWFVELKGLNAYHKKLKAEHFSKYNKSDFERFFVVEIWDNPSTQSLKEISNHIIQKFCNIKRREPRSFCPYIAFVNLPSTELVKLKAELWEEGVCFIDGYPFVGSKFTANHILKKANYENKIQLKFVEDIPQLNSILNEISKTKEVYYFFKSTATLKLKATVSKFRVIEITELEHIKAIV